MNDFWYLSKDKSKNFKWSKLSFDSSEESTLSKRIFVLFGGLFGVGCDDSLMVKAESTKNSKNL